MLNSLPIAIIGGGPIGLAAAVRMYLAGEDVVIFERGEIGAHMRAWGHVQLFSSWDESIDPFAVSLLRRNGVRLAPQSEFPTGLELVERYLFPLARLLGSMVSVRCNTTVIAVARRGEMFEVRYRPQGAETERLAAKAVIDAGGTFANPSGLGAGGLPVAGETQASARIAYGVPDIAANAQLYGGRRVTVVGSGHSALTSLVALADAASPIWAIRGSADAVLDTILTPTARSAALVQNVARLVAEGRIQVVERFTTETVVADGDLILLRDANGTAILSDRVIAATGFRPDHSISRELHLETDAVFHATGTLAEYIDPAIHSCGTVPVAPISALRQPEQKFYVAGIKSYGRAPTFLLRTGYALLAEIIEDIVARAA